MKMNFTNQRMNDIFDEEKFVSLSKLMFDTGMNRPAIEKKLANEKIREIMFEVMGIDETASRREIRRAIRKHQIDIFEVIEDAVENLLTTG